MIGGFAMQGQACVTRGDEAAWRDQRSEQRFEVRFLARLVFNYQLSAIDIRILDISRHGCRLRLRDPIPLPRTFLISFPDIRVERPAWLAWQRNVLAGVRFLDEMPPDFIRLFPPGVTP